VRPTGSEPGALGLAALQKSPRETLRMPLGTKPLPLSKKSGSPAAACQVKEVRGEQYSSRAPGDSWRVAAILPSQRGQKSPSTPFLICRVAAQRPSNIFGPWVLTQTN